VFGISQLVSRHRQVGFRLCSGMKSESSLCFESIWHYYFHSLISQTQGRRCRGNIVVKTYRFTACKIRSTVHISCCIASFIMQKLEKKNLAFSPHCVPNGSCNKKRCALRCKNNLYKMQITFILRGLMSSHNGILPDCSVPLVQPTCHKM
jgi:hypothetical protein